MSKVVAAIVFALTAGLIWQTHSSLANSQALQQGGDPVSLIRAFANRSDMVLTEIPDASSPAGVVQRTFVSADGAAIFAVDMKHNQVVTASMPPNQPQAPGSLLDQTQAFQIAQAFVAARVPSFAQLTLVQETQGDHGAVGQEYRFMWAEQLGSQKALGLQRLSVSVDVASGSITSFMYLPAVPLSVNVEPTIMRDQALSIAEQHFGASVKNSTAELDVWWLNNDRSQPQVLRWKITLVSDEPLHSQATGDRFIAKRAAYVIDAHTGVVLDEMR